MLDQPPRGLRLLLPLLALAILASAWGVQFRRASAVEPPPRRSPEELAGKIESIPPASSLLTSSATGEPPAPEALRKTEPALLGRLIEGDPSDRYQVILELEHQTDLTSFPQDLPRQDRAGQVVTALQETARRTQPDLIAFLEARGSEGLVQELRPFWVFNGIAVTADRDTILAVAERPEVRTIREDRWRRWVSSLPASADTVSGEGVSEWNIAQIQADIVWSALGLDGSSSTVAIMDTGVDWQHPALSTQYRGYRPSGIGIHKGNWICTTDEAYPYPVDRHGHGTHVTGIAVGGQDPDGVAIGVAPGARWIAAKPLNDAGYGYDSWIHAAFEWLLAPDGDPSLAPDVVNGSWGSVLGAEQTFRADVQSLRAAGIVPIFSAGNGGPGTGTLEIPGSYPEAIAVGATDDLDRVTSFSSRGPSYWGEIKPEVSAPGAQIRSSLPGNSYGAMNGTSMAAPHVTGLVALILQADPTLSVDAVEAIITSTALPLGDEIPNNDTGWGRIDAYRAAAATLAAGEIVGQVSRQSDQEPLPTAQVTVYDRRGDSVATAPVDELGRYYLALPEGRYDLEASAFGYTPSTAISVWVEASTSITLDMELSLAPAGVLWGEIRNAETGDPVGAELSVISTPAWTASDPQTGQYSIALPAGIYTVTVSQNGYRRATAEQIQIVVDDSFRQDFALAPAPTLLLVDAGRRYYASQASYFQSALDDMDYVYNLWEIRDLDTDVPEETDLAPFDITIWSFPGDSPGLIGAGDSISDYLKNSGNLFLTGQNVGYWDSGLNGMTWHPYYRDLLKAQAVANDAGHKDVVGVPGEPLDGLSLAMNSPDSAGNQNSPDLIALLDPLDASLIGVYEEASGGGAALRASGCQSYNAIYFAAGLEGLGDSESRAEVMDRALTWLDSPHPSIAVRMTPLHQETVWLEGSHITHTIELQNRGATTDQFSLDLSPSAWPVSIWDASLTGQITQSMSLGSCQTQTLAVQVTVPPDTGWDVTDVVTLTARSQSDPRVAIQAAFSTKTPAPILLVDDHRWYDTSNRYRNALEAHQLPYDAWRIPLDTATESTEPSLDRLLHYPVVIWFTAYDWYRTLTPVQEATLSTYLDSGGRLLLSSQDYLFTSGFTDFARDYLGVLNYTDGLTVTQTLGAVGHPVGKGLAPTDLVYPFRNFSDALRPSPEAGIALWGQHGQPVALTMETAPWKTAFYAFAIEAFGPDDMTHVLGSSVDWLSPLGNSTLEVSPSITSPGSELTCTMSIRNTGPRPLSYTNLSNPIPAYSSFVAGSLEGPATYEPDIRSITWTGTLVPDEAITITYRLQIDRPLADGTMIENVAYLSDETGLSLKRMDTSRVDSPYLGASAKVVNAGAATFGQVLTYTLYLRNDGLQPAEARLSDPIPANSSHLPGSGWASSGLITSTEQLLAWSGMIGAGEAVTVTFPVNINPTIEGFYVHNRASLTDGWGEVTPLETYTLVQARIFLPLILKGF